MNAPVLWIVLPSVIAFGLLLLSNKPLLIRWMGLSSALFFALLAGILPIDETFIVGPLRGEVEAQLVFFGRRLLLENADRPLLLLIYLLLAFWFSLGIAGSIPSKLYPLGLILIALVITGYAVEPIFYAAIFFGFLTMLSVILLSPSGAPPTSGALRFLVYQILGTICILFAAWLLSWVDLETVDKALIQRTMVLMGLGFSFLLGIFPFTSWISMTAEENPPFLAAFIFFFYINGVLLFALKYLSQSHWVLEWIDALGVVQWVGLMMIVIGGVSAVFVTHVGRMMGVGVIVELGRSLVGFSLQPDGTQVYFAMLIIQGLALGIWSLALSSFQKKVGALDYPHLEGLARTAPITSLGLLGGIFTLAGLPLAGGFPLHWALGTMLQGNPSLSGGWFFVGNLGLLIGGIRTLSILSGRSGERFESEEPFGLTTAAILLISLILLATGLVPHLLLGWVSPVAVILQF